MKALVFEEKHKMTVQEVEKPVIAEDEVLVNVKYCGVCGTDVHIYHGEPGSSEVFPPVILGHEFSGEVVEIGSEITTLEVGDHVAVDPNIYCGHCKYCRQGRVQLCDNLSAVGVTRNGGMAEYSAVPENACLKLDKNVSLKSGAMVEPLSCVLHGFDQIDEIKPTTKVLVIGGGFIGSLFLQAIQLKSPAKVVICELNEDKHENLLALGADEVYKNSTDIKEEFDLVVECIGLKPTSEEAVRLAAKGANILLFGVPSPSTTIELPAFDVFSKELKIAGSFINPFTLEDAVQYITDGKIEVDSLFSHEISLEEVPELLENYSSLGISKAIINLEK